MKVLMIGNAGGHFEQLKQLKRIEKNINYFMSQINVLQQKNWGMLITLY